MRSILSLFLISGLLAAADTPRLVFDKVEHNFGTVERSKKVTVTFGFTNKGKAPLVIKEVKTSCGCTSTDLEKAAYDPGDKGQISLTFDSLNFQGQVHKSVTVISNDPQTPETLLEFSANVVEDVMIEPGTLLFENARMGADSSLEFKVSTNQMDRLEVKNLTAGPEWLTASMTQVNPKTVMVKLLANGKKFPSGQVRPRGYVSFDTNSVTQKTISLNLAANVSLPIQATPNFILLWASKKGEKRKVEVKLNTPDKKPFKVIDTFFEQPFLSVEITKEEPDLKVLVITLDDKLDSSQFRDQLRIVTDMKDYPEILIPVRGSVVP